MNVLTELINFVWFVIPFTLTNNRGSQDFVRLLPGGLIGIDRLKLTQGGPTFDDPAEDRVLAIKVGRWSKRHEKLGATRILACVGHAERSGEVVAMVFLSLIHI